MTTTIDRLTVDNARMTALHRMTEPYVVIYKGLSTIQCTEIDSVRDIWDLEVARNQDTIWPGHTWRYLGSVTRETAIVLVNHYLNVEA